MEENKEILFNEDVSSKLLKGVNKLADAVLLTYGPNGNTVILFDDYDKPYVTKDGVSVSNSIELTDPTENAAAVLIKEVAQRTLDQAGDGTTTSIALAKSFINKGYSLLFEDNYNYIKNSLESLEHQVLDQLKKSAIPLTQENIINVATVSTNGDIKSAKLIEKAYKHSNIVKVEESNNLEDSLITIKGLNLKGSYFDRSFINNAKNQSIEYDKAKLIIIPGKLESLKDITTFLMSNKDSNICIMADHFSDEVLSILKNNFNTGALKIGLIKTPGFADHRKNLVSDIIKYTKSYHSLDKFYVSDIDGITATKDSLIIRKDDAEIDSLVDVLKENLKMETESYSKELLQQRIDILEGTLSIIKVGGYSEVEMKEKKDRVDDAVLAVACAIEEGIVDGGGWALVRIADYLQNEGYNNPFFTCLYDPCRIIFKTDNLVPSYLKKDIIDPVKVTRIALENAISVSKTILSTSGIVLNNR